MVRKIRLLTVAYGERYLDLFQRACLRSLWQPGNIPALLKQGREIEHLVVTPPSTPGVWKYSSPHYKVRCVWYENEDITKSHSRGILEWMKMCADDGSLAMAANPDWFFADGSVANMVNYLQDRDLAVAGLYARVDDKAFLRQIDLLHTIGPIPISSAELVHLSMMRMHYCLKYADISKDSNHSANSGVFVQHISDGLWSMNMRVPNVFLTNITYEDCREFEKHREQHKSGWWDWVWPSRLMEQGRLKFLQSSDLFFMVDLTQPDVNHPVVESNRLWNDDFINDGRHDADHAHKARLHSLACKAFVGTMRGTQYP